MKSVCRCFCLLLFLFTLSGCSAPQTIPAKWVYQEKALTLYAKCDNNLNLYENTPHTLFLCIYQLTNPNSFNQLSNDVDGLYKILECNLFDASVVSADNKIVYPGDNVEIHLDRAENAKFIGIVAGYANMDKQRITKLYQIPEVVDVKGFFRKSYVKKPGRLKMYVNFGPYSIEKTEESM